MRSPGPPQTESLPVPAMIVSPTKPNCTPPELNALIVALADEPERLIRSPPPPLCGLNLRLAPPPTIAPIPPDPTRIDIPPAVPSIYVLPAPATTESCGPP